MTAARENSSISVTKLPTKANVPEIMRPVHSVPADDLVAVGKRLRDTVPRARQGVWKRHEDRADPLSVAREFALARIGGVPP